LVLSKSVVVKAKVNVSYRVLGASVVVP